MDQRQQQGRQGQRQWQGEQDLPQQVPPIKRDIEADEQKRREQVEEDEERGKQQS
jgi:hypothetical protein